MADQKAPLQLFETFSQKNLILFILFLKVPDYCSGNNTHKKCNIFSKAKTLCKNLCFPVNKYTRDRAQVGPVPKLASFL